jgi:SpoVK/Ycf46/Vps4 family AAA+-type ATPase
LTKDNYVLDEEAESKLKSCLENIYYKRDKSFGNGRDVRNLYERCLSKRAKRLQKDTSNEHDLVIYAEDIPMEDDSVKQITLADALTELENLVGLNAVKEKISDLIDFLEVEKIRSNEGGEKTSINIHFVFKGNPGTGKTTVARILANIFKTMGLLTKGQLVETDRKDLVAEFVGQTAPKTNKVIESALGGVLFIDEAYTLSTGGGSDFGKEAIDTLLKRMEDDRGKLIVIAAGYNADMEKFLNSNPGLTSRFTYHVQFDDYTPEEMVAIFGSMLKSKGMKISSESDDFIVKYFSEIYLKRDKNFANGRTVRNVFEKVLQSQAKRLSVEKKKGVNVVEKINIITKEDFN